MLTQLYIRDGRLTETGEGDAPVWVYTAPDETERKYLIEQIKLDEHTLNSALDPDELSRLEFEPEHAAIIFKRPKRYTAEDNFLFRVVSTGVFLFKDRLIIVRADDAALFEGKPFIKILSVQDVFLKLIYRAISHFVEHLRGINMISTELEQQINIAMENKYLLNLFTLEKSLVYYLSAINSNGVLVERLRNAAPKLVLSPENVEFLDDILVENSQCRGQTEIYSQVLSSLMDARASIISNNLNVRIKALTIITIGIMLPTFIVSLFSMNVGIPMSGLPYAFWIITGIAAATVVGVALLWRKLRW
ncbi:MAG: magnesium transporter CorA family protein [Planctomycetes bacterium]|jgi:magnesium transporter|nr:magnesium transporter CorA family protein [Planctomycetota bacterium]